MSEMGPSIQQLLADVRALIASARATAVRQIDALQVFTNYEIGRLIVEHEQQGRRRATYGKEILKQLAANLMEEFGRGYSLTNLKLMRQFYIARQEQIGQTSSDLLPAALRPIREQAPELYKESLLGWIPKEWEVKSLDSHVRIIDCKHYTPEFRTEGYPFVRPRNVKLDGLDLDGVDYVSVEDFQLLTDVYRPRRGDIVFSRNASFGVPCYVDSDVQFAIGQDVVIMTEKTSVTRFVYYALTTLTTTAQIAKVSAGSTFGRINLGEIRKLLIPQPDDKEQKRIYDRMVACDVHERELKAEVAKLCKQKHGLMQDLLTGRVQVPVAKTKKVSTMAHVPSSLELTI